MSLATLDAALQSACPAVMCPRYGALALLETNTHRFIVGSDGLYVEIRRAWAHAILPIAPSSIALPYGRPPEVFELRLYQEELAHGLRRFIEEARKKALQEHAAWLTFNPASQQLGYVLPEILSCSSTHIRYKRPRARADCLPIVDCHSHGKMGAYFSARDNKDDLPDDAKLSFVVGNLDQPFPSVVMRFVGLGAEVDLSIWVCSLLYPGSI
jgi:PRTRC genetic system protein A